MEKDKTTISDNDKHLISYIEKLLKNNNFRKTHTNKKFDISGVDNILVLKKKISDDVNVYSYIRNDNTIKLEMIAESIKNRIVIIRMVDLNLFLPNKNYVPELIHTDILNTEINCILIDIIKSEMIKKMESYDLSKNRNIIKNKILNNSTEFISDNINYNQKVFELRYCLNTDNEIIKLNTICNLDILNNATEKYKILIDNYIDLLINKNIPLSNLL